MNDSFYCAAPWRGLHINPRGDVKTCCAGNPNMLGNLNTNTIEQILNNNVMTEIRASLAQGQHMSTVVTVYKLNVLVLIQNVPGTTV